MTILIENSKFAAARVISLHGGSTLPNIIIRGCDMSATEVCVEPRNDTSDRTVSRRARVRVNKT
jgi:hypothetical protein